MAAGPAAQTILLPADRLDHKDRGGVCSVGGCSWAYLKAVRRNVEFSNPLLTMVRTWAPLFAILSFVSAFHLPLEGRQTNDGVHLAITPACGKLGGAPINVNAGVVTTGIKTLVAFGVCVLRII